ncbi:MAG: aspartate--tRNA ligase [Candidatus Cloacimonadota bacterium]|nr:MAG: aspartate--tRNA ligase [Candidatus Cloacimonadota bacterium]PIE77804.1 MAG: aspartate--tRNA ligase [Candidatus Delongbacteria bacterium]
MKRNRTCGELRKSDEGTIVTLSGWVHKYRNLGGLLFLDLRDRYGITQVIFDPEVVSSEVMDICTKIRNEYVVTVQGIVNVKPEPNKNLPTGEIEIEAKKIRIENESETPPFNFLNGSSDAREDKRLEYRYLDLRSERMTRNIVIRHKATLAVRQFLSDRGFLEIETPTFSKSTPEGARDYVVPSRLFPGSFYALPQSPQIYKQLLMVSGFDKYFQIARCFRDEDARGDRQPEFTQIDIEKSFTDQEEIFKLTEEMYYDMFLKALDTKIESKFVRLTYHESMEKYGVDKPDLRFGLTLKNITDIKDSFDFKVINSAEHVKFIAVEGLEGLSRKQIKVYEDYAIHLGAKGLAFVKYIDGKLEGGISKFLSEENMVEIIKRSELTKNGIIFFGADSTAIVNKVLGNLRNKIGKELELYDPKEFKFCWITDFPMFEFNDEENRWEAMHHMFTMPRECDIEKLDTNPGEVLGICYDLVLNGVELASGSIRIHDENIQNKVFRTLGLPQEEIDEKFGFMLKAFKYGAPPHGGIAPGLDRTIQIMCGEDTIREVIAFPKAKNLNCPMMKAPSPISEDQLNELNIKLK